MPGHIHKPGKIGKRLSLLLVVILCDSVIYQTLSQNDLGCFVTHLHKVVGYFLIPFNRNRLAVWNVDVWSCASDNSSWSRWVARGVTHSNERFVILLTFYLYSHFRSNALRWNRRRPFQWNQLHWLLRRFPARPPNTRLNLANLCFPHLLVQHASLCFVLLCC